MGALCACVERDARSTAEAVAHENLRWSKPSTEQLLRRLGAIPAQCGLKRLFGGIRVSDYADLIPKPRAKKVLNGNACAVLSVGISLLLCDIPDGQRFQLVFEQQDVYINHANIALATLLNDPNPLMQTKGGDSKLAEWTCTKCQYHASRSGGLSLLRISSKAKRRGFAKGQVVRSDFR
jgi:hypothetical protein